jgi:hypothetical protein
MSGTTNIATLISKTLLESNYYKLPRLEKPGFSLTSLHKSAENPNADSLPQHAGEVRIRLLSTHALKGRGFQQDEYKSKAIDYQLRTCFSCIRMLKSERL